MSSDKEKKSWTIDQITKSEFFHQKLHEWGLLEIAYELESIQGENLKWSLKDLNITTNAWNRVIHRGIKPVRVFVHPEVLKENSKRLNYYRMLAMVSQKSMAMVGLSINQYERRQSVLNDNTASGISQHLNKIISILIEHDEEINAREFDLWRGMAAGSQAQGSWQNIKGDKAEIVIKEAIERVVRRKNLVSAELCRGRGKTLKLKDGRQLILGSEPDIGVYRDNLIQIAVEIKGGIDPAGILERFGAALKTLRRAKQKNPNSLTILIMQRISFTAKAKIEIEKSKTIIDHLFMIEDVVGREDTRKSLFKIMGI